MEECPALRIMKLLGEKWVIVMVKELSDRRQRFNELQRNIGRISSRTLAKRLKELEKVKIIEKRASKNSSRVMEYSLTEAGKDLMKNFKNLGDWLKKWDVKI